MMIPQAYRHATPPPTLRSTMDKDKNTSPSISPPLRSIGISRKPDNPDGRPKMLSSISTPTPSKPVIIPTRTQTPRSRRSRPDDASSKPASSSSHDPMALPPSMTALLNVASLQSTSSFTLRRSRSGRNIRKESLCLDDFRHTLSSSSPKSWSILQGPPGDGDEENKDHEGDSWSIDSGSTVAPLSSYRSLSSDSMPSLDMESDLESLGSPGPLTPASRMRVYARREKRQFYQLSVSASDHPLSPPAEPQPSSPPTADSQSSSESLPLTPTTPKTQPRSSSFKSNLTASIRLLKSAARSLSEIAPKQYVPDPIPRTTSIAPAELSRSSDLASSPAVAAPAIRNIDALPFHLHLASPVPNLPPSTASIQLMPYVPSTIPSSTLATAPPVFLPAANPVLEDLERKRTSPRPREPRENSDFLRVVVLEMNMRRLNKLSGEGRARIWLAPRMEEAEEVEEEEKEEGDAVAERILFTDRAEGKRAQDVKAETRQEGAKVFAQRESTAAAGEVPPARPKIEGTEGARRQIPRRWVGVTP